MMVNVQKVSGKNRSLSRVVRHFVISINRKRVAILDVLHKDEAPHANKSESTVYGDRFSLLLRRIPRDDDSR